MGNFPIIVLVERMACLSGDLATGMVLDHLIYYLYDNECDP